MNSKQYRYLIIILSVFFLTFSVTIPAFADESESFDAAEPENVDSQTAVIYTVKKGDTLWDLSQRFNNDAWQWPGVWGKNKELTNPHLIYPGQKIKLFSRNDVEQIKKLEVMAEEEVVETTETVEEVPEFVDPEETDKTAEAIEPVEIEPTPEPVMEPEKSVELPFFYYSKIESVGFMRKKEVESHGYIFEVKGREKLMLSKGDEIYIKEAKGKSLTPGAKYFTYEVRTPKNVRQKLNDNKVLGAKRKKTMIGHQHVITGIVEVTGKKSGYAVAKITRSFRTIRLEHMVMPYIKRSPEITLAGSVEGLEGMIISSEEQESLFADNKIAFIDKGRSNGVKTGQMYNIYYSERKKSDEFFGGKHLSVPVDFASFIVLHTEELTSTILITSAYKGIASGDKWHFPQE